MPSSSRDRSRLLVQAEEPDPQGERHHEVVAHHGGERDRLHDHHPGRGRQAAQEHREREQRAPFGDRQREHERVGVHAAAREVQQPAERDRQHEQVDRQHVQGKQPARLGDVRLVDVLDDGHLELPRQAQDRERREHEQPRPARVAPGRPVEGRKQAGELRIRRNPGEQVAEPAIEPERDEQPDGEKGDELDDRLEGDRGDHPFVALRGVEMPGTEQDREHRERQRGIERGVGEQRHRHRPRPAATLPGALASSRKLPDTAFSCSAM